MKIVGAIDIKAGRVVRAVAGERNHYRPLDSRLVSGSEPAAIAGALLDHFALRQVYVADLDALAGAEPAWEIYGAILKTGVSIWVDAGLSDVARIERMADFAEDHAGVNGIIGALECLPDRDMLKRGLEIAGPERFLFGLDLKDGRPLTTVPDWQEMIAAEIAAIALEAGVQRLIVVDVAAVGMHGGCPADRLCRTLHDRFPDVEIYAGGGIRGVDDLHKLARHGCRAALCCSALHDGWLAPEDLAEFDTG